MNNKYLQFKSENWYALKVEGDKTTITIDGVIGGDWMDGGTTAKEFIDQLNTVETVRLEVHINSPGGSVFDGFAIYNALTAWSRAADGRELTVIVDGLAASIASVIAMAGDSIMMPEASVLMIHLPWTMAVGNAAVMRDTAETLDKLAGQIAKVYADRSGISVDECMELMRAETYIEASEAVEKGFATALIENQKAAACVFSAELYGGQTPLECLKVNRAKSKREREKALRDAGHSRSEARMLAATSPCDAGGADFSGLLSAIRDFSTQIKEF